MEFLDEVQFFRFDGINYLKLFEIIRNETLWEKTMRSRWTASYGKPYNYNDTFYDFKGVPEYLDEIIDLIDVKLGYRPNNCLINFYNNRDSKMGYHSDNIDILEKDTGITILSLGAKRVMKFKNIKDSQTIEVVLDPNSFFHMSSELQKEWKHSVLSVHDGINETFFERISVTFRRVI
ncbi:alpha-ketoglutarate-dependent dioxygenase AlkB [Sphingobacterium pedocola]|uniref:Alpha-ketoglutarate-dependent dioxygenase AlkB n=1 Tax=Sphingobacterium pedocola TaxID=2082722 RepID=A0ABR9T2T2_9SPHI|nr:alpha-ketoglutarate-dependent dioxygenase AlkB [Sphingobacterium pedocola]MBE8719655.1 alpha-ketoglutarate-dependent dioxygenase AlkB [Sphingobacterium pedocola]